MSKRHYRVGLLGNHISSSFSPSLHNTEARAQELTNFSYELVDLASIPDASECLGDILDKLLLKGFTGFNVTHPYKQHIISHLDDLSETARRLGSVNTIVYQSHKWFGYNTDQHGFLSSLQSGLPQSINRDCVVLVGAGGAGVAVAGALLDFGVQKLYVVDKDKKRRSLLKKQLDLPLRDKERLEIGGQHILPRWITNASGVINATPVGMHHLPGVPFDTALLKHTSWVVDLIYQPVETELLAAARAYGGFVLGGAKMLVEQAAETFELQTGLSPNRLRMRQHLTELLADNEQPETGSGDT